MNIVTVKQMQSIDKFTIENQPIASIDLMEQAAVAIFNKYIEDFSSDLKALIVVGQGNNGGDGLALARLLQQNNYPVEVYMVNNQKLSPDCQINYDKALQTGVKFTDSIEDCDIIVDCLFGTGLSRDIEGKYYEVISQINKTKAIKLSIDIPSGINGDNGKVMAIAVKADKTYTLAAYKTGLLINDSRSYCGEISLLDIGIKQSTIETIGEDITLISKDLMKSFLPERKTVSNKGSYGKVIAVGGCHQMSGAMILSSKSALKAGCGMMCVATVESIHPIIASNVLEATFKILPDKDGLIDCDKLDVSAYSTILFGCGINTKDQSALLSDLLDTNKPIVIDADGLKSFKKVIDKYINHPSIVITPHLKEFADLTDQPIKEIVNNPIQSALDFSKKYPNITLVLKSDVTVIARNSKLYVNTFGNNGLAKGGSGDVLAGVITGLLAQSASPLTSATLAVYLHAVTADILAESQTTYSILPSEVCNNLHLGFKTII